MPHDARTKVGLKQLRLPLVLQEMLASEDPEVVAAAELIADLPSPDLLCPFCVVIHALEWPGYATLKLCADHLPIARALQCKGWNAFPHHQRLAALARWGRLPDPVEWCPDHSSSDPIGRRRLATHTDCERA
ncbi:MAG TPA: hypothetical protein VH393_13525 [Ktedonobacterales bacterium]|jgi:hypothetical protein